MGNSKVTDINYIQFTCPLDLSGNNYLKMFITNQSTNVEQEVDPSFVNDGSDGKVNYKRQATDITNIITQTTKFKARIRAKWATGLDYTSDDDEFIIEVP
jgi:hypothetical protein